MMTWHRVAITPETGCFCIGIDIAGQFKNVAWAVRELASNLHLL